MAQTASTPPLPTPSAQPPSSASSSPRVASDITPTQRLSQLRDQWQGFNRENQFASRVIWEREALVWAESKERELKALGRHYQRSFPLPHPRDGQEGALTVGGQASSSTSPEPAVRAFVAERDTLEKQRTAALDAGGPLGSSERAAAEKKFEAQEAERLRKHRLQAIAFQQAPVEQLQEWRELSRLREEFVTSLGRVETTAVIPPSPPAAGSVPSLPFSSPAPSNP